MKRSGSNKRVARKIGHGDDEEHDVSTNSDTQGMQHCRKSSSVLVSNPCANRWLISGVDTVVKRPPLSSKVKKGSKLRLSFGPGESAVGEDDDAGAVVTPKRSLGRQAIERNAERKTLRPAVSSEQLSFRAGNDDRPSYSKDSLAELKLSTPSTPKDGPSLQTSEDEAINKSLDVASKFGSSVSQSANSAIPTAAEIREKKERRARLAQEKEFISLDADDSEDERRELLLRPKEKYAETRLVREDEDLAEGFDDYVEDGKIALGRKAEREDRRRKRKEMEELIAEAEDAGEGDADDDSEVERNEAYEAAQTRAGTYGQKRTEDEHQRPRTPPKITLVPDLNSVLTRMREGLQAMQDSKAAKTRKLEELAAEKKEIAEREVWIQAQLKEVGERYEKLRMEAGMAAGAVNGEARTGETLMAQRGLESYGSTPRAVSEANSEEG